MKKPINWIVAAILTTCGVGVLAADSSPAPEPAPAATASDFELAKKSIAARQWSKAVDQLKITVSKNPKDADAWNLMGYSYRWLGQFEQSFSAYDKALALDPNHKGALNYSGIAYIKSGQKDKAAAQLKKLKAVCAKCEETVQLETILANEKAFNGDY
jgi:Flp pilus assembly protein TadD